MLKSKAHQMTEQVSKGEGNVSPTKDETEEAQKPKDVAFVAHSSKDVGDDILKDLIDDEETEQTITQDPNDCLNKEEHHDVEMPGTEVLRLF